MKNKESPFEIDENTIEKVISEYLFIQNIKNVSKGTQLITQSGDIKVQYGLSYTEVANLLQDLFEMNFPRLRKVAQETARKSVEEFRNSFFELALKKLTERDLIKFADPDVQFILNNAIFTAARRDNDWLRNFLSNLIIERIKKHDDTLLQIIFNEAIKTMDKLTLNQLKILALVFITIYHIDDNVNDISSLNDYFNHSIKPFIGIEKNDIEFIHLEYSSCASIGLGERDIIIHLRDAYSSIFAIRLRKDDVDAYQIKPEIKSELFNFHPEDDRYSYRLRNKLEFDKILDEHGFEEHSKGIYEQLFYRSIMQPGQIEKLLLRKIDIGQDLVKLWKETMIGHLNLTSVGFALGGTYYNQITGDNLNIDEWLV